MSSDKRALDDLDALFRDVPAKAVSSSRPVKKFRNAVSTLPPSSNPVSSTKRTINNLAGGTRKRLASETSAVEGNTTDEPWRIYNRLPKAVLPLGLRAAPSAPRGKSRGVGAASAIRLAEFVRGVLSMRGERAATSAIESRLQKKVVHLEKVSAHTGLQGVEARSARAAGRIKLGLSGRQCKKKGMDELKARDGSKVSFRDLLGLHDLWKSYAERLVSQCRSNQKLLQQRVLSADLQLVTPKGKRKTVPKRGFAFRTVFGGLVVNFTGKALEGRRGGKTGGRDKNFPSATSSGDKANLPLRTAAL